MHLNGSEVNLTGNVSFEGNHANADGGKEESGDTLSTIRGVRTKFTALFEVTFTPPPPVDY